MNLPNNDIEWMLVGGMLIGYSGLDDGCFYNIKFKQFGCICQLTLKRPSKSAIIKIKRGSYKQTVIVDYDWVCLLTKQQICRFLIDMFNKITGPNNASGV